MYLMYVDESGDTGLVGSPSQYFILSGLVLHELNWKSTFEDLKSLRRDLKNRFNLPMNEEIHASHLISRPGKLAVIPKHQRMEILRMYADRLARMSNLSFIHVVVDKAQKGVGTDVFSLAWRTLIQRFENTILKKNFPGSRNAHDMGMLFPDRSDERRLNRLVRKMRAYNPVPLHGQPGYRMLNLQFVIEDANMRDSAHSYFIQSVDVAAYLLHQHIAPSSFFKRKSGQNYFLRLDAVLCKAASSKDPQGIVRI